MTHQPPSTSAYQHRPYSPSLAWLIVLFLHYVDPTVRDRSASYARSFCSRVHGHGPAASATILAVSTTTLDQCALLASPSAAARRSLCSSLRRRSSSLGGSGGQRIGEPSGMLTISRLVGILPTYELVSQVSPLVHRAGNCTLVVPVVAAVWIVIVLVVVVSPRLKPTCGRRRRVRRRA